MKRVIHIGDGRHIEIEEGELRKLPPAIKQKPEGPRYASRPTPMAKPVFKTQAKGGMKLKKATIPGYSEWLSLRKKQTYGLSPNMGRRPNQAIGQSRADAELKTSNARKQALKDMTAIKASGVELTAAGEEALLSTITIMRANGDVRVQLAAARQVLEWTKAKPAASTNVNVNAAEAWLASLSTEPDDTDTDSEDDS